MTFSSTFLWPDTTEASALGGKGAALARLGKLGFDVPPWFAVPPGVAWRDSELAEALEEIGPGPFAVRSSGASEDGAGHSFAGQFESHLEVSAEQVPAMIDAVRRSAASKAILSYCREHGLAAPGHPTVLVQRMIEPKTAGVAFSADPVSARRGIAVISAVAGTGEKLVSGEVDGEVWRIDRFGNISAQPEAPLLSLDEARSLAALARRCETACGLPQDIEWAIDRSGKLWLLQSRPITTLALRSDPDDLLRVWDNSNIAESYGGVTTPLTFSFARRIYEAVYREFCRLMSVPEKRIERADEVFPQMLGMIRGRVYYNLTSWYRVLALLPGFRLNRRFMEQMMGVREELPQEIVDRIIAENRGSRAGDVFHLLVTGFGLIRQLVGLDKQIARFQRRLDTALTAPPLPLERMSGEELVAHYRDLERQLLKRWDAPLVNDFFAMIFYGVLRGLCTKWAGDTTGALQNELLLDCGDIISAEPPRRILRMAALARNVPGLPALLVEPDADTAVKLRALRDSTELEREFEAYLDNFGDRCLEELKLESPTVRDDPDSLLTSIGAMALREVPASRADEPLHRPQAAVRCDVPPLKRPLFNFVLRQAKKRVRIRENLRFERTRLFGRVRNILRQLGHRLHADGVINDPRDVLHLELGDVLAVWEATGTTRDLGRLARQRREEFEEYENSEAPPDRFTSRGPVGRCEFDELAVDPGEPSLVGTGACPGRVSGKVRLVLDPRGARLEPGEILVARQTDPGWVVLFPAAAGLLVERGSLLSHSAIVSRELRLPCIVSLPGITRTLKTGDHVEMDGTTGAVRILEAKP